MPGRLSVQGPKRCSLFLMERVGAIALQQRHVLTVPIAKLRSREPDRPRGEELPPIRGRSLPGHIPRSSGPQAAPEQTDRDRNNKE